MFLPPKATQNGIHSLGSLASDVKSATKTFSYFCQLRNICQTGLWRVMHAFIISAQDVIRSLYSSLSKNDINCFKMQQPDIRLKKGKGITLILFWLNDLASSGISKLKVFKAKLLTILRFTVKIKYHVAPLFGIPFWSGCHLLWYLG